MNKQEAIKQINSIKSRETFMSGIIWIPKQKVLDIVDQIDESQKVVVPKVAIEYYEAYKDKLSGFDEWFGDFWDDTFLEEFPQAEQLSEWLYGNDKYTNQQRELVLAMLIVNGPDAVEIEQEQLYTVEIPNPNNTSPKYKLMLVKGISGVEILRDYYTEKRDQYIFQLTESEIRKDFEWAWQWAKPVEVAK